MNVHSLCADLAMSMKEERVTKFVLSVKRDISASKVKKLQPTFTLISLCLCSCFFLGLVMLKNDYGMTLMFFLLLTEIY